MDSICVFTFKCRALPDNPRASAVGEWVAHVMVKEGDPAAARTRAEERLAQGRWAILQTEQAGRLSEKQEDWSPESQRLLDKALKFGIGAAFVFYPQKSAS